VLVEAKGFCVNGKDNQKCRGSDAGRVSEMVYRFCEVMCLQVQATE